VSTCATCGTTGQSDGARFCLECGSPLAPEPACDQCGSDLPPTARFCPSCGSPRGTGARDPAFPEAPRSAARRITSVLFGDLVGFTTISESRDAEEVRELLSAYFDECRAIVGRYGGELEKFIGDAVMAVWGLPVTREDDAERAVRAGLELVERVQALGERIGVPGLNMRVGITTAEVAVTLGASGQGMVAGDPVNTAARIQSTAEPGEVWVDQTTRKFSSSAIAFGDAGEHPMKGKAEPVALWRVQSVIGGAGGERRDEGIEARLVGRDGELRLVKELFHRVQETARPGLLVLDGDAGVGKSRLGWEFYKYIDGFDASVLWHRGRCLSYGEGVAYYALAEAVRGRLTTIAGVEAGAETDMRLVLETALADLVADPAEREWLRPRLAALLGLDPSGSYAREDLFVAWTAFFAAVGLWRAEVPQPVVLVIDDAQHADEGLLGFLEHLVAAADFPIFVLVLARPELLAEHPGLVGNRRVTVVHLEPLSRTDMTLLVSHLVANLPQTLSDELVVRAEGLPLFAIETVRSLLDQRLVEVCDGRYVLRDPAAVDLGALAAPTSLQALVSARLDTLPADERLVVDRASVLGQVFFEAGIRALCADVPDLDAALTDLVRRQVIGRETDRLSADFGHFHFVQGVVRQVAYGMLARRDRKAIHLQVAATFEAELETRSESYELAPMIAQHYLDAIDAVPADPDVPDLTKAASDHLERAADRAAALGAPREAAAHLTMALARCAADRRATVQGRLARQLRVAGEHERAIEHAAEALASFDAAGNVLGAAGPVEDLARALVYSEGDLTRAEREVTAHLARIPVGSETLQARLALTNALATVHLWSGNDDEHRRVAQEALVLAEFSGEPRQIAEALNGVAISNESRLPDFCTTLLQRTLEIADEHRDLRRRATALVNLRGVSMLADLARSIRYGRDAVAAAHDLGDEYVAAYARTGLALSLTLGGEWDEALELASRDDVRAFLGPSAEFLSRSIWLARGDVAPQGWDTEDEPDAGDSPFRRAQRELTRALRVQGSGDTEATAQALAMFCAVGADLDGADLGQIWMLAAEAGRDLADSTSDREPLAALVDLVEPRKGPWPLGIVAQRLRLQALLGRDGSRSADEVDVLFRDALDAARSWGSALYDARICSDYGTWLLTQGRTAEGEDLRARARAYREHRQERVDRPIHREENDRPYRGAPHGEHAAT
jgi:class 3 adenylate cyclase/tetratricopeptide (TPR) repeat protein